MELIDLFDKNRKYIKTISRGEDFPENMYRIVVHLCIFSEKGEMLIQQRSSTKTLLPDMWDITVGGQVISGETSCEGIQRELKEELGLDIDFSACRPKLTVSFSGGFDDIYIMTAEPDISSLVLQEEEVQAVQWADEKQILKMISDGIFVPYHESYIKLLFTLQDRDGTFDEAFT